MKKNNSRFKAGSGVYSCTQCGKRTRETGDGESQAQLCADCYEKAGDDNSVADGTITEQDFFDKWGEHSTWYKPAA